MSKNRAKNPGLPYSFPPSIFIGLMADELNKIINKIK